MTICYLHRSRCETVSQASGRLLQGGEVLKIIVVSDTHMTQRSKGLPARLLEELPGADLILHAGDWTDWSVYEALAAYAPVEGIAGNNDGEDIVSRLGYEKLIEVEGKRIGMIHGDGFRGTTEQRALKAFADQQVDCIVFGHSHVPLLDEVNGIMLLNPGSATDKRMQQQYSFAILTVHADKLHAEHIFYSAR